jgi:hypothetical protein
VGTQVRVHSTNHHELALRVLPRADDGEPAVRALSPRTPMHTAALTHRALAWERQASWGNAVWIGGVEPGARRTIEPRPCGLSHHGGLYQLRRGRWVGVACVEGAQLATKWHTDGQRACEVPRGVSYVRVASERLGVYRTHRSGSSHALWGNPNPTVGWCTAGQSMLHARIRSRPANPMPVFL